ncbi:uncharacterized protein J4E78_009522 [Alternaria triticimaculans]|uniref:uncharacterized protein n=1 Tax=Alternaria triticimaculans TaxID=297637 RepID=UPI0020C5816B|nr:uncharacterized protein J4E78_009522 [Alternaria triticimaculans]KAI4644703.1 hypothetical protein J4E78_009522 [Alternaria triticimaculans]
MHAVALKSHGHSVVVLEMRTEQQLQARAAGLSLWSNAQKVFTTYLPDVELDDIVFRNPAFPILDKDGKVLVEVPFTEDVRTSCWAGLHGLLWMACEKDVEGHGPVSMRCGYQVCGLTEQGDHLVVSYKGEDGIEEQMTADMVVAADGARSHLRSLVLPDVKTDYVGYVAWRSQFPEKDAPEELRCAIEGKMPLCMLDGSYIVVYLSPSTIGDMRPGNRVIEWCWYDACDASTPVFADYMTDVNGVRHNVTVPGDLLRPDVWEAQLKRRDKVLSPMWRKIFHESNPPLLTAVLAGEMSLGEWEKKVAQHAMEKAIGSRATGIFGMTGQWPEGYTAESAAKFSEEVAA